MNINNIKEPEAIPENIWKEIFDNQKRLAEKYKVIENMGDLLKKTDTNVDTAFGQKWLKDFAWRTTEEITEAMEAKLEYDRLMATSDPANLCEDLMVHYLEELIDALHFITELAIIAGYDHTIVKEEIVNWYKDFRFGQFETVYYLGLMCNCLKNKPWKQTQMLTDRNKFRNYLKKAYHTLIVTLYNSNLNNEDIYKLYFRKMSVNQFRIRSKY